MTLRSIIIAGIAFTVVYGGLLVIGAQCSSIIEGSIDRTTLLSNMVNMLLGKVGMAALSVSVMLACLSTASGLIGIASDFLESLTKKKVSYRAWVTILCITSILMACTGVENIISVAAPVFMLLYPSGLVLTILGLTKKFVPNDGAYRYAVIGAIIAGILDALNVLGVEAAGKIMNAMPFASFGFGWVIFALLGFFFGSILFFCQKKDSTVR